MRSVLRILDANLNRAREAARVVEEHARFLLDDADLCGRLKAIRHALASVETAIGRDRLLAARDTDGDEGRTVTGAMEYSRSSPGAVATANIRRLQEALRVLEEYSKVSGIFGESVTGDIARELEQARYQAYETERALMRHGVATGSGPARRALLSKQRLMLVLTSSLCSPNSPDEVIRGAWSAGVRCFQLREKDGSDRERLLRLDGLVKRLRDLAGDSNGDPAIVIVNDRVDFALAIGADGVHLGQDDLGMAEARRIGGNDLLIGRSTRNEAELRGAMLSGADYVGAGSMFQTATKQKVILNGPAWGATAATIAAPMPVFCIGGIGCENISTLKAAFTHETAGGDHPTLRIAVSSAVCGSPDPKATCKALMAAISP